MTNANDCPNLLSYGATFRMGVLLPNSHLDMVVKGENVPHFSKMSGDKMRASTSPSYVFQILGNIRKQQAVQGQCENPESASPFRTTTLQKHSTDESNKQAGKASTCTCISCAKHFTEWTSNTWCTCPQAAAVGSEAQRLHSLTESQAPPQW